MVGSSCDCRAYSACPFSCRASCRDTLATRGRPAPSRDPSAQRPPVMRRSPPVGRSSSAAKP
ncbi:hypothetical protein STRTUCAR8_08228 [Streptomyces turgidiscabies Car8]|uniref:Uncharacterized protein n=1 Tax=Streptomyces turgidiscabies (strain Car8) TaxID=698760 RepID=L7FDJ6_STRT8|nr:hypothetical protein STRTUCAR8_08228 [Streptomyces turgidiscabies Car8]